MIWIVLIIAVVGFIMYNFFRDRDQMLKRQVDMQGGIAKKYEYLVDKLTQVPSAKVSKVTRDQILIRVEGQTTSTNFIITETFNKTEIEWVGQMAMLGTHKHKWTYPHNYPQERMIDEIGEYMAWKSNQLF